MNLFLFQLIFNSLMIFHLFLLIFLLINLLLLLFQPPPLPPLLFLVHLLLDHQEVKQATRANAFCSTTLPTVSVAMCSAVSMGTPLPSRVPIERENSVSWYLSASGPMSGRRKTRVCHH